MQIEQLREKIRSLPEIEGGSSFWDDNRKQLRESILNENPSEFKIWPVIQATMFVGEAPYLAEEKREVASAGLWDIPDKYKLDSNDKHQAFHFIQLQKIMRLFKGMSNDWMTWDIVEIGGGYGALARILRLMGFTGNYHIYDFPEFSALQEYYLSNTVGADCTHFHGRLEEARKHFISPPNLLIALYSISEMRATARDEILGAFQPENYLFAFQEKHFKMDNRYYFGMLPFNYPDKTWVLKPAHPEGNHYLFGIGE